MSRYKVDLELKGAGKGASLVVDISVYVQSNSSNSWSARELKTTSIASHLLMGILPLSNALSLTDWHALPGSSLYVSSGAIVCPSGLFFHLPIFKPSDCHLYRLSRAFCLLERVSPSN
jgi:hypothetical protein